MDHFGEEFAHQRQVVLGLQRLDQQEALRLLAQQGFQFGIGIFLGNQQQLAAEQVQVVIQAFGIEGAGQFVQVDGQRAHGGLRKRGRCASLSPRVLHDNDVQNRRASNAGTAVSTRRMRSPSCTGARPASCSLSTS